MDICEFEWVASIERVNTEGERFKTLPLKHICVNQNDNHKIHICPCGETKETK